MYVYCTSHRRCQCHILVDNQIKVERGNDVEAVLRKISVHRDDILGSWYISFVEDDEFTIQTSLGRYAYIQKTLYLSKASDGE